jgi:hypothetical protein
MPLASQFGYKEESTVGTAVTVDKFGEFVTEGLKVNMGRTSVVTKRAGQRVARSDRAVPYQMGASGPVTFPMLTKGGGIFLKHALGSIATAGPTDSTYTHTATIGDLTGKSLTLQVDRPFNPSGTSQAFTYNGCKITKAEFSLSQESHLEATYEFDGWGETTATALASASYPSGAEIVTWASSSFTIGGSAVELVDIKITLTNGLNTDRRYIRGSAAKKEQLENAMRSITVQFTLDFVDLTQHNRVVSTTQAGSLAACVLTCNGPTLLGATTYPGYTFTMPAVQFDDDDGIKVDSDDPLRVTFTGTALFDGTNSALTVAQRTADTTPS